MKAKIQETKTSFHNNQGPRRDANYMGLSIIRRESGYLKLEEHILYLQVFLEVCRYGADNRDLQFLDKSEESDNMLE